MALMLTKKDLADKFAQEMNVSKRTRPDMYNMFLTRWRKH